ncbi:hypothetical protein [uncultured Brachyspira sp.]|uniref:hypothetical protein n=1 Tax=uncultured Brachyspira sp. TaxID=221953 RepID=UPI0025F01DC4|nr:hypothetical protein [uncultured Brachyspira sp.]
MKFYFTIIIFVFTALQYSFAQDNYNLDIKFRVIEKFDKILSSDNKEYTFYIDANYTFTDEGKKIYRDNINNIKNTLNDLENQEKDAKTQEEKSSLKQNIIMYQALLKYNTPPKKFIALLINRQIHQYISKYPSKYIDKMMNNNLQEFYDDIKKNIIYNEKYTGNFTSLRFLTKERFKYFTGRT